MENKDSGIAFQYGNTRIFNHFSSARNINQQDAGSDKNTDANKIQSR